jgi:N-acetylglucosamine kinase-like BadF-type ATPase
LRINEQTSGVLKTPEVFDATMQYFLGFDIGNSKSHALIADENGQALGLGTASAGSWEAIDWDGARQVWHAILDDALAQAEIGRTAIAGAGICAAGYDWPEDRQGHIDIIESLGMVNCRYALGNDTLGGLVAGAEQGWGINISAGTSNNCMGRDRNGREGRVTGCGSWFGENGGAAEIVRKAMEVVAAEWTQRGPKTALTTVLIEHTGAVDLTDLLAGLVRGRYHLTPAEAPLVFATAANGDPVAQEIITWAGTELASLAIGVVRQLDMADEAFDVVLSGSLFKAGAPLIEPMRQAIQTFAPGAKLVRLDAPPVIGGVLLGMQQAGLDITTRRARLLQSTNELIV